MKKAIFIDKDGTLIADVPYNVDPALVRLDPYAPAALRALQVQGYLLLVVSNQPGVALGYFSEADLQQVYLTLCRQLRLQGVRLDGFYYCPHDAAGKQWPYAHACYCRKPLPGMLLGAAAEHGIDLAASWMIGDILHDVEAGNRAGCSTILLDNGHETEWVGGPYRTPLYTMPNLWEAANLILQPLKRFRYV